MTRIAVAFLVIMGIMGITANARAEYTINICTGGYSGKYYEMGQKIKSMLERSGQSWKVNVIMTEGSQDNVARMLGETNSCDAAIVQEDVPSAAELAQLKPITVLYKEPVLMWCNDGTDDIDELKPAHQIHVGSMTGGTAVTMRRIIDALYTDEKKRPKVVDGSIVEDLGMLPTMPKQHCYAQVVSPQSDAVAGIEQRLSGGNWRYVDTYDSDLNVLTGINGGQLYTNASFKSQKLRYDDGEFAAVNAIFVVTQKWWNNNDATARRQIGGLSMLSF